MMLRARARDQWAWLPLALGGLAGIVAMTQSCIVWTDERAVTTGEGGAGNSTTATAGTGGALGGAGGAGGAGAVGGQAGEGGGGALPGVCLDPAEHEAVFTIRTSALCLLGKYQAAVEVGYAQSPTWGRHAGPITATFEPNAGEARITRWHVPAGQTGDLAPAPSYVGLGIGADPVYFGAQIHDLPFGGWTLLSWTGDFGSTDGEALLVSYGQVVSRLPVVGMFDAVGIAGVNTHRLVHTSLSPLTHPTDDPLAALYAADFCPGPEPCDTSTIATWGEASGPVASDRRGNVFALQASYSNDSQTLRAFAAAQIAPGTDPTEGADLLTLAGFGSELAALTPTAIEPGLIMLQPFDSETYQALDVLAQPYVVTGMSVTAATTASTVLQMTEPGTPVTLMSDMGDRLWVGVVSGPNETTFYVVGRVPVD